MEKQMEDWIGPLSPLEPAGQLDAYFQTLGDIGAALADFERLADLVLASDDSDARSNSASPPPFSCPASASSSAFSSISAYSAASPFDCSPPPPPPISFSPSLVSFASPNSPGGQSNASSVNCCASCTSNWPAVSANSSSWSAASSSSVASSISTGSSYTSTYSNFSDELHEHGDGSCSLSGSLSSGSSSSSSSSSAGQRRRQSRRPAGESRRKKNATAAERYRKRVKGRRSSLLEELEQEQERNTRLRRNLNAKLELYGEFADLLAQNTRDDGQDCELARLGSRSLTSILEFVCPADERLADPRRRSQLEQLLAHFRRIQTTTKPTSGSIGSLGVASVKVY